MWQLYKLKNKIKMIEMRMQRKNREKLLLQVAGPNPNYYE